MNYSLRVEVTEASAEQQAGILNGGYWGMPLQPHTTYKGSLYAKADSDAVGELTIELLFLSAVHGPHVLDIAGGTEQLVKRLPRIGCQRTCDMRSIFNAALIQFIQNPEEFNDALLEGDVRQESQLQRRGIIAGRARLVIRLVEGCIRQHDDRGRVQAVPRLDDAQEVTAGA